MWVQNRTVDANHLPRGPVCVWQVLGLLVPVSSNTSRCFHFRPIDPLVWAGALPGRAR